MAPMQIRVEPMTMRPEGRRPDLGRLGFPVREGAQNGARAASKIDVRQGIAGTRRHVAPARLLC